jgi:hypothetical protein
MDEILEKFPYRDYYDPSLRNEGYLYSEYPEEDYYREGFIRRDKFGEVTSIMFFEYRYGIAYGIEKGTVNRISIFINEGGPIY